MPEGDLHMTSTERDLRRDMAVRVAEEAPRGAAPHEKHLPEESPGDGETPMTEADQDPPAGESEPRPGHRRWAAFLAAGLVLAVLLVAANVVLLLVGGSERSADSSRQDALATARQFAVNLITTDPARAEESFGLLRDSATGALAEQLAGQSDDFASAIRTANVTSSGTVTEAGVAEFGGTTAKVLLVARSDVRNGEVPEGETRQYRMLLALEEQDSRWLVSNLDFVP
jgi:Mce-associated membrane protein